MKLAEPVCTQMLVHDVKFYKVTKSSGLWKPLRLYLWIFTAIKVSGL